MSTGLPKKYIDLIVAHVTFAVNNSLKYGIFPTEFKTGLIVLIQKQKNANKVENYRRISILPVYSKIFEKAVYIQLLHFLFTYLNEVFNILD